jgi:hypothetical protein
MDREFSIVRNVAYLLGALLGAYLLMACYRAGPGGLMLGAASQMNHIMASL